MTLILLYVNISEYQKFGITSNYQETSSKTPFGYHFSENEWANVYNSNTNNIVGKILTNNNYYSLSINNTGGYCNNNNVIFIDNAELNKGSMEFVYNFYSNTNTTNINPDISVFPTFCQGTQYYYLKKIQSKFINNNNILNIIIYIEPTIYPTLSIKNNVNVYWKGNEIQTFREISDNASTVNQFGYNFFDIRWGKLYNLATNNKIGYFCTYNTFQNINNYKTGGYCKDSVFVLINDELPIGTIGHTYTFLNNSTNTNYIKGARFNTTVSCLTGEYYGKNVISTVYVDPFLTRFNYFTILE